MISKGFDQLVFVHVGTALDTDVLSLIIKLIDRSLLVRSGVVIGIFRIRVGNSGRLLLRHSFVPESVILLLVFDRWPVFHALRYESRQKVGYLIDRTLTIYPVNRSSLIFVISLFIVAITAASVFAYRSGHRDGMADGEKLGLGRQAWMQAAENRMFWKLSELGRADELPGNFEENMWLSILELNDFYKNPDAPNEQRTAAEKTLRSVILHFYLHPRQVNLPKEINLADSVSDRITEIKNDPDTPADTKEITNDISEVAAPQFEALEELFGTLIDIAEIRDVQTKLLVEQLIEQRFLPGRKIETDHFTLWRPTGSGGGGTSGGGKDFDYELESTFAKVHLRSEDGNLVVNGEVIAPIPPGAEIDFRVPRKVFINETEYKIRKRN